MKNNYYNLYGHLRPAALSSIFLKACKDNDLDVVRYVLTSPEITNVDVHTEDDLGFRVACQKGNVEIVKYLLTSPDLKEHADIHAKDDLGFQWACMNGHLEVVKYLLTSPDLTEHADIHAKEYLGFQLVCREGHLDVIAYLLSFDNKKYIDFQKTEYNLDWALENKYNDIIIAMMKNLKNNNPFEYLEYLPNIESYNKKLYTRVKNIEVESLEVNPQETSLYL